MCQESDSFEAKTTYHALVHMSKDKKFCTVQAQTRSLTPPPPPPFLTVRQYKLDPYNGQGILFGIQIVGARE